MYGSVASFCRQSSRNPDCCASAAYYTRACSLFQRNCLTFREMRPATIRQSGSDLHPCLLFESAMVFAAPPTRIDQLAAASFLNLAKSVSGDR